MDLRVATPFAQQEAGPPERPPDERHEPVRHGSVDVDAVWASEAGELRQPEPEVDGLLGGRRGGRSTEGLPPGQARDRRQRRHALDLGTPDPDPAQDARSRIGRGGDDGCGRRDEHERE
jgi:hypothetical protein